MKARAAPVPKDGGGGAEAGAFAPPVSAALAVMEARLKTNKAALQ